MRNRTHRTRPGFLKSGRAHAHTRKHAKHHSSYGILSPLQHHHLLLRCETERCPGPHDIKKEATRIYRLVRDLGMKPLDKARVYYMNTPQWNKGLTAFIPIQTSHIAFHFWTSPDHNIFHNARSKCLLQLDIYTCGALPHDVVPIILRELDEFKPTHLDCTVFNRKYKLLKELEVHWDAEVESWGTWLKKFNDSNI